jgi:hypothetical protein
MQACQELERKGLVKIKHRIFAHPTVLGERLIGMISGQEAQAVTVDELPSPPDPQRRPRLTARRVHAAGLGLVSRSGAEEYLSHSPPNRSTQGIPEPRFRQIFGRLDGENFTDQDYSRRPAAERFRPAATTPRSWLRPALCT